MSDENEEQDDLKIKLFKADYYTGVGQPYLLLAWDTKKVGFSVEEYYFIVQKPGEFVIKKVIIEARESVLLLFPDFEELLQKEILPQAEYFVFFNFLLPVIENDKIYSGYKLPQFEEIDILRLYQLKQLCPKALGRVREASRKEELRNFITYILPIENDISQAQDI
jgi:hypothetical protein